MPFVAIAFGSNVGDRVRHIVDALKLVGEFVKDMKVSGLYETAPMYVTDQPDFINGVVIGQTDLGPTGLLSALKETERAVGRAERERNGPREVDLDIIWMDSEPEPGGPDLPHPRGHERRFVLDPLNEIAPNLLLPGYGTVQDLLMDSSVQSQLVRRVADAPVLI